MACRPPGVTIVDGNTVIFSIDEPDEGTHDVHIAAGALVDLQGTPLDEFTSHYTIDLTPPTVVASSIQEDDVLPAGSLSYQVTFSEPMNTANLDASDFLLHGNFRARTMAQARTAMTRPGRSRRLITPDSLTIATP